MDQYELQFIEHEQQARNISQQMFVKMYQTQDKKQRQSTIHFLNKINQNLISSDSTPRSKYMTILILRDVLQTCIRPQTKFNKLFSSFLNHKLLQTLEDFCQTIDPNKAMQDKGRKYFPGEGELGHNFIRCILEIIKMLASKFPKGKNQDATAFKKKYNKLAQQKVTFPNDWKFISLQLGSKIKEDGHAQSKRQNRNSGTRAQYKQEIQPKQSKTNPKQKDLKLLQAKVKAVLEGLDDGDDEQYLQAQITKLHQLVMIDDSKFQTTLNELFEKGEGEEIVNKYINANEFINVQKQSFQVNINQRRNLLQYASDIRQAAKAFMPASASSSTPDGPQIKMTQSRQYDIPSKIKQKEEMPPKASYFNPLALNGITQYFQEVQKKSKSPIAGGFKKINQSLSRQKAKNTTLKSRLSPHARSNLSRSINSLKGSKIAAIFANPPNANPPQRYYQGTEINQNFAMQDLIRHIDKFQGHRRFCTSNFKGKGSIFQNQHIQIGFKSQSIYQEVSGFRVILKVELFFGNLSEQTFRNLTLDFKGDQNILLYANPREIQRSALKGEQNKIDLVIIPLKPQFPMLTMKINYQIGSNQHQHFIIIPNSVLKFINFMEISKNQFLVQWESASLFKTTQFSLSHHLPPDTLVRWIPSLAQINSYNQFVVPGSRKDYELFTSLMLMQRYQALLRITIRPNLRVVLQLGIEQKSEEAVGYFMTFLQHLQQIMKQSK